MGYEPKAGNLADTVLWWALRIDRELIGDNRLPRLGLETPGVPMLPIREWLAELGYKLILRSNEALVSTIRRLSEFEFTPLIGGNTERFRRLNPFTFVLLSSRKETDPSSCCFDLSSIYMSSLRSKRQDPGESC